MNFADQPKETRYASSAEIIKQRLYESRPSVVCWKVDILNKKGQKTKAVKDSIAGGICSHDNRWYVFINKNKVSRAAIVWILNKGYIQKGYEIDHIDRNSLNDCIGNLRLVTSSQNKMNRGRHKNNKVGIKGVSWSNSRKKYEARIQKNGKQIFVGYFNDISEAETAIKATRKMFHGNYACHGD